jgi:transposase
LSYRHTARVSIEMHSGQEGVPKPIIDRAWDAQLRLCRRYCKVVVGGKCAHVAIIAVARELVGLIWGVGRLGMTLASTHDALAAYL